MYLKKIVWAVAILGLLGCALFSYWIYDAIFGPNTRFEADRTEVLIATGANFNQVRDSLKPLLKDISTFEAVARRKGYTTNVKAGRYLLKKGMNNNEIINTLRSANQPVMVSFNNQESLSDLAGRIAQQIEADSLSLITAFEDPGFLAANGFDRDSKLGMYIPNTYEFFWNTGAEAFRDRMKAEYDKFWNAERLKKAEALGLSPQQATALAAIVQKETVKVEERPRVAGVYLNRLERDMLLQADPTVIHAIKRETGNFDTIIKRVLFRDLEIDSPYNTYKYAGIPPGPISMPDISSIDAVLSPEDHDYLYFVADVSNFGYHLFAKTLLQHNRNKAQYVQWLNSQKVLR